jgi:hypothetical protein
VPAARPRPPRAPITVPEYLAAVQRLHGIGPGEMARAMHVSRSVMARWTRGALVPSWRRVRSMTALWGGSAELLALGAALQRWTRATGMPVHEGLRMLASGRRHARPAPRRPGMPGVDRRQLPLPIAR